MERRNIGRSGIKAGVLSMGTWAIGGGTWWGENDDPLSIKSIEAAIANEMMEGWKDLTEKYQCSIGKSRF